MTIITRSALVFHGHNPAPDVHSVVIEHRGPGGRRVVTWAEVMEARRERQRELLRRKREVPQIRAYKLWVAYFDMDLMGGWHAFLEDCRGDRYRIWVRADWIRSALMTAFPLGEQWEAWKPNFATRFERRRQDGHPLGVTYLWWNQRDMLERIFHA